jgi:hypothetical protein
VNEQRGPNPSKDLDLAIRSLASHGLLLFVKRVQKDLAEKGKEREARMEEEEEEEGKPEEKEGDVKRAHLGIITRIVLPTLKRNLKTVGIPNEVRRAQAGLLDGLVDVFPFLIPDLKLLAGKNLFFY